MYELLDFLSARHLLPTYLICLALFSILFLLTLWLCLNRLGRRFVSTVEESQPKTFEEWAVKILKESPYAAQELPAEEPAAETHEESTVDLIGRVGELLTGPVTPVGPAPGSAEELATKLKAGGYDPKYFRDICVVRELSAGILLAPGGAHPAKQVSQFELRKFAPPPDCRFVDPVKPLVPQAAFQGYPHEIQMKVNPSFAMDGPRDPLEELLWQLRKTPRRQLDWPACCVKCGARATVRVRLGVELPTGDPFKPFARRDMPIFDTVTTDSCPFPAEGEMECADVTSSDVSPPV